jgi:hypothetical protein
VRTSFRVVGNALFFAELFNLFYVQQNANLRNASCLKSRSAVAAWLPVGAAWKLVDAEQFNGWQQLHDSYINVYLDCVAMGLRPTQTHPNQDAEGAISRSPLPGGPSSRQEMVGNCTMNLRKFDDGWKIVASHTSVAGM